MSISLLLLRSDKVGSYCGRWGSVSGYREGETLDDAYRELAEEVGLTEGDVELLRTGPTLPVDDPGAASFGSSIHFFSKP